MKSRTRFSLKWHFLVFSPFGRHECFAIGRLLRSAIMFAQAMTHLASKEKPVGDTGYDPVKARP